MPDPSHSEACKFILAYMDRRLPWPMGLYKYARIYNGSTDHKRARRQFGTARSALVQWHRECMPLPDSWKLSFTEEWDFDIPGGVVLKAIYAGDAGELRAYCEAVLEGEEALGHA